MRIRSFSTRLSFNVLLIVAILFTLVLLAVALASHIIIADEATRSAQNTMQACIADVEKSLNSVECAVQNTAWNASEHLDSETYLYHVVAKIVEENPFIIGSTVAFDTNGFAGRTSFAPYCCMAPLTGTLVYKQLGENYNYFESDWFVDCERTGNPSWSEPYFDAGGGDCLMTTFSYPIKDSLGHVVAVMTADVSLNWFAERVEKIRPYEHSFTALISEKGKFLSKSRRFDFSKMDVFDLANQMKDPKMTEITKLLMAGKEGTSTFNDRGKVGFAVYGQLDNGWKLMITSQYRDVLKRSSQMHFFLIVEGIIGLLILFFVCRRIIRRLTQPLTEFSVAAQSMAKGNFRAQLPEITSKDELLKLNDSFKYLQQSITTYISELRATTSANQRMESELNVATAIQMGMLPQLSPNSDRYDVSAMLLPAKEVGGDLYDFLEKDDQLYFVVGDVSGKGVPAALVMAITQAACRFFFKMGLPMDKLVTNLNNSVADGNETGMFATLFAATVNLKTKEMEFCNAGHNHLLVVPPQMNERPYYLNAKANLAIGLIPDFPYVKEQVQLQPGTTLVLYTDGVTEAENTAKELFGDERLLEMAAAPEFRQMTAEQKKEAIYNAVKMFTVDNEQNDDITLMVITF